MARNIREPIPLPVILAASEGDERALNAVLNHYKGYIRLLFCADCGMYTSLLFSKQ